MFIHIHNVYTSRVGEKLLLLDCKASPLRSLFCHGRSTLSSGGDGGGDDFGIPKVRGGLNPSICRCSLCRFADVACCASCICYNDGDSRIIPAIRWRMLCLRILELRS